MPGIVSTAITNKFPADSNGIYLVLTSAATKEVDPNKKLTFCAKPPQSGACGFHHTNTTVSGTDIKYAWIGDPSTQCPNASGSTLALCPGAGQLSSFPNGNASADLLMASTIAHEIAETITDPDGNAWNNGPQAENADICQPALGVNSATFGNRNFFVQSNYVNQPLGGGNNCQMQWTSSPLFAADLSMSRNDDFGGTNPGALEVLQTKQRNSSWGRTSTNGWRRSTLEPTMCSITTNDVVYHVYQDPSGGGGWSDERPVGTTANKCKKLVAGNNLDGREQIIYIGTNGMLYQNYQNNDESWAGEFSL